MSFPHCGLIKVSNLKKTRYGKTLMINFLDLLFPSALGTIVKSLSESCAKFSSSRRPSGENTGGPQGLELTSALLMAGLRLRPKSSNPTLFFLLSWLFVLNFYTSPQNVPFHTQNKHLNGFIVWEMVLVLSSERYLSM